MNEFDLIKRYFQSGGLTPPVADGVELGIGDDCALLYPSVDRLLAVSMDTLVADVHFPAQGDPALIGERALRVNLSDLAACGARPRWFTLALTLPEMDKGWLASFSQGLLRVARQYDIHLVGGDTTKGPLSISVQVHGEVEPKLALRRDRASAGELIYVSGTLGDAAAAVKRFHGEVQTDEESANYFLERYYRPQPRVQEAQALAPLLTAAIDISDGLIADLGHICERSSVGATVNLDRLPLSAPLIRSFDEKDAVQLAAGGGDDYELCMFVPQTAQKQFEDTAASLGMPVSLVGSSSARHQGVKALFRGEPTELDSTGYQHF
ncbi:thiamine-phosphate kinase [Pseudoteredinibacter isoporae]|uniref:thiamine-phosphate kinase n=1 Tax=Pseudoteredinibacter isoporae TaxID=570281 RepID=UPI00310959C8